MNDTLVKIHVKHEHAHTPRFHYGKEKQCIPGLKDVKVLPTPAEGGIISILYVYAPGWACDTRNSL